MHGLARHKGFLRMIIMKARNAIGTTLAVSVVSLVLAGCSSQTAPSAAPSSSPASSLSGAIVVDAASSLTGTYNELGADFEKLHPGTKVTFNYGASSALAATITSGAPVDVFAAASPATMKTVTDAHLGQGAPVTYVTNTLEIAVPNGNPGAITGLKDFGDASKKIAICAPQVPCGSAAVTLFQLAGIKDKPDTLEPDVKTALAQVASGDVDAALVYHTDILAAGKTVTGITFPEASKAINDYSIVPVNTSNNLKLATAFTKFVLGGTGQAVLSKAGFVLVK
jgi:molybdate transport system substrate-binding protein